MLDWADVIFIMDDGQRRALRVLFPAHPTLDRIVCLDIPDHYGFLQPELVQLLEERVAVHLNQGA